MVCRLGLAGFSGFQGGFSYAQSAACADWMGVSSSYFWLSKEKQLVRTARAVANGGRIPIARRVLAVREGCIPHLGSDPYWRFGAAGVLGAMAIPGMACSARALQRGTPGIDPAVPGIAPSAQAGEFGAWLEILDFQAIFQALNQALALTIPAQTAPVFYS